MESFLRHSLKHSRLILLAVSVFALSGCSGLIYKVAGKTTAIYGQGVMMPYLMTTDDTAIACVAGESLTPLMLSFNQFTSDIDQLAVLTHMVGGVCADHLANEAHLDYLRLARDQRISSAQDARIQAKRFHALAAKRQYKGYKALVRSFGEIGESCPNFASEAEQFVWIIGVATSLQAVLSDTLGGMEAGVPKNIAPKAMRAAACLDNEKGNRLWWGLPKSINAVLASIIPGAATEGIDPWQEMNIAAQIGEHEGVRMSQALMAIAANNASNTELLKDTIRAHAASLKKIAPNREYYLVDVMATDMITMLSDTLWTEAVGHRTPHGGLGSFWDDKSDEPALDINMDDL
ncbi:MAG: hypothetical protein COA99_09180 [Moraxellaceae bacterium]|nr:MAG: hypothetical protein COA99_09180 [Moraxellaceae bacterium]